MNNKLICIEQFIGLFSIENGTDIRKARLKIYRSPKGKMQPLSYPPVVVIGISRSGNPRHYTDARKGQRSGLEKSLGKKEIELINI